MQINVKKDSSNTVVGFLITSSVLDVVFAKFQPRSSTWFKNVDGSITIDQHTGSTLMVGLMVYSDTRILLRCLGRDIRQV